MMGFFDVLAAAVVSAGILGVMSGVKILCRRLLQRMAAGGRHKINKGRIDWHVAAE